MPKKPTSPLEQRLENAVAHTKRQTTIWAKCPRCLRRHECVFFKGMRVGQGGAYLVWCHSCWVINSLGRGGGGRDIAGQLFIPGLMDDDDVTAAASFFAKVRKLQKGGAS